MPNVSPCGFVRDFVKELFSQVSDEAARQNVRLKIPISVTKNSVLLEFLVTLSKRTTQ